MNDFIELVTSVYDDVSYRKKREEDVVSKENIFVRESLARVMGSTDDFNEEFLVDKLFKVDFYVPSAKLIIEINGRNHYYPYSTKFNQFTNFKHKLLISKGYNIFHLNSWVL